jgi:hypothetical protein
VRPAGQSITAITLPADVLTPISYKRMIGPPRIAISGNGHGATAIADYDDATRTVKGVIVTSPGYGYDGETTVTVDSWDRKSTFPCTYMLGEVAGGGFTKKGGGKLTLGGANNIAGLLALLDATGALICVLDESGVEVSRGNITSYSADQLTRALVSVGRIALQYYGQDAGTGLWEWLDALSMIVGETVVALGAGKPLNIQSGGSIDLLAGTLIGNHNVHITLDPDSKQMTLSVGGNTILTITATAMTAPSITASQLHAQNGATGMFTANGKTVTVVDGVITSIA